MEQVTTSEIWDYHPGTVRILVVRGDLDAHLSTDLRDRLERALTETPHVLFVDLEDVTFMDPSAVAVLVEASKQTRASGAVLRLVAPSDPAERLLRLTHTENDLPVERDLVTAYARVAAGNGDATKNLTTCLPARRLTLL